MDEYRGEDPNRLSLAQHSWFIAGFVDPSKFSRGFYMKAVMASVIKVRCYIDSYLFVCMIWMSGLERMLLIMVGPDGVGMDRSFGSIEVIHNVDNQIDFQGNYFVKNLF